MTDRAQGSDDQATSAIVDALAGEGEAVGEGGFRLDPAQARAKLRSHQLDDPNAYVLLLVEAAALAGDEQGPRIEFELGSTSEARIAGLSLSDDELRAPFDAIFANVPDESEARRRARALRLLGLATNAALAAGAKAVVLESSDAEGQRRRALIEDGAEHELKTWPSPGAPNQTRFQFVGGVMELSRPRYERDLIKARCRFATTTIVIEDEPINLGLQAALPEGVEIRPIVLAKRGQRGVAAMVEGSGRAKVLVLTRGVLSETIALDGCRPGFVAVIDIDLRKDLSQRKLVRDAEFEAVEAAVRRAHDRLPKPKPKPEADESEELSRAQLLLIIALVVLPIPLGIALIFLRGDGPGRDSIEALERRCEGGDAEACLDASQRVRERERALELGERGCELGEAQACARAESLRGGDP